MQDKLVLATAYMQALHWYLSKQVLGLAHIRGVSLLDAGSCKSRDPTAGAACSCCLCSIYQISMCFVQLLIATEALQPNNASCIIFDTGLTCFLNRIVGATFIWSPIQL